MKKPLMYLVSLLASACSPPGSPEIQPGKSATSSASESQVRENSAAASATADPGRSARYSTLENCKLVRVEQDEMPYTEELCAGPGGWSLRISDSDARQTLAVVAPGGKETRLETARIGGGGFSSFGKNVEWRAPAGATFAPDALVVRYQVADRPHPAPETSYLLAVRLRPGPCIVARIAPADRQNERARAAADGSATCIEG